MKNKIRILLPFALLLISAMLLYLLAFSERGAKPVLLENPVGMEEEAEADGDYVYIEEALVPLADGPMSGGASPFADEIASMVNNARAGAGLMPLRVDPALNTAAQIRAAECVGCFSHTRPDGSNCKTVLAQVGVNAGYTGENVASGYSDARSVFDGWMNSEGHRANIMNPRFTRIGVGSSPNSGNQYRGYAWAQVFACD